MKTRDPDVFTIREAAAFLAAHEQTVRKLARRGVIPSFKVGTDWRFRKEALLRWSDGQKQGKTRFSVLVIDDEEKVCRVLGRAIERFGYSVRQSTSARNGLLLVRQDAPDVIVLDLKMPDMNGPQFLEELRKTHLQLPVVIVTAYPDNELMYQAMRYAPVMLLAKPVELDLLERTVRSVVGEKMSSALTS